MKTFSDKELTNRDNLEVTGPRMKELDAKAAMNTELVSVWVKLSQQWF